MKVPNWVKGLEESIPKWLEEVSEPGQPGRFYPCLKARTRVGSQAALGFSCFALKIYRILGLWEQLEAEQKRKWINFILSFQKRESPYKGAFVDPAILEHCTSWKRQILDILLKRRHPGVSWRKGTLIAETKQAIATLADVGIDAPLPFRDFPNTPDAVKDYLQNKLNWSRPWAAGGQAAALALFVAHEGPRFMPKSDVEMLKQIMVNFFYERVDKETGAWFSGRKPHHGELVNGAMKVLNALEWLNADVPYPKRLIDMCLSDPPQDEGCHLVDFVYVIHCCSQYTIYRRADIEECLNNILDIIKCHLKKDGAFSYYASHNQTHYYGAKVANLLPQSDLHGTVLLTWALAVIGHILKWKDFKWRLIRV